MFRLVSFNLNGIRSAANKGMLQWAEGHAMYTRPDCALYLQPEWSKRDAMTPLVVNHVMAHPRWRISLQTHKYLNIP